MVSKKSSVIIATIVVLIGFLSLVYVSSCTKPGTPVSCDGVVCENGGFCDTETVTVTKKLIAFCTCPSGFEGSNCSVASVSKYIGTWDVVQKVTGSDSAQSIGTDSLYQVQLIASATPTTFMIYNLCGDQNYNDIVCTIDSSNSNVFIIDSQSAFHMIFDHFKLSQDAVGVIAPGDSIVATLCTRHLDYNVNWVHDTFSIVMKPHH